MKIMVIDSANRYVHYTIDYMKKFSPEAEIYMFVRNADDAAILEAQGIHARIGDYTDRVSLVRALEGIEKLLFVSVPDNEFQVNILEVAKEAGISFITRKIMNLSDSSRKENNMKKTIIINASPRKNWNTAQLLKSAEKGAKESGAETEYIDLYDLNFTGCRSCLACKANGAQKAKCFWKDDLSPVIDKILKADNVIIGSPIYFGEPTAHYRALLERLLFVTLSYNGDSFSFDGKVNVGIIYTMNGTQQDYENLMKPVLSVQEGAMKMFLHGDVNVYTSCDTLQVSDYSKYAMGAFSEQAKKEQHENQFPIDLEQVYNMGAEMSK